MAAYSLSSRCVDITNFSLLMLIVACLAQLFLDQLGMMTGSIISSPIKDFKINEVPVLYYC